MVALGATNTSPMMTGLKLYSLNKVRALVYFYEYFPTAYSFLVENMLRIMDWLSNFWIISFL